LQHLLLINNEYLFDLQACPGLTFAIAHLQNPGAAVNPNDILSRKN
jgi:hypothetical protein